MSIEDHVYTINWKKTPSGWELWVKGRPEWRAAGTDVEKTGTQLAILIMDSGGAMHPVFSYEPELPPVDELAGLLSPELFLIGGGNEGFHQSRTDPSPPESSKWDPALVKAWQTLHFTKLPCETCKTPGPRTERPITLENSIPGDGCFGDVAHVDGRATVWLYSGEFLDLLTSDERSALNFRQTVRMLGLRGRRKWFELTGPALLTCVAVSGADVKGWQCERCGATRFHCRAGDVRDFIAAEDLPKPVPTLFTVQTNMGLKLGCTGARWAQLRGKNGTRGILANRLCVVPTDRLLRNPPLESRNSFLQGNK